MTSLGKDRMIKSRKDLGVLFEQGASEFVYPLKCVYLRFDKVENQSDLIAAVAPKRVHRKAVTRNLLKRRIKEAYRLNQHLLDSKTSYHHLLFIYIGKKDEGAGKVGRSMKKILKTLNEKEV